MEVSRCTGREEGRDVDAFIAQVDTYNADLYSAVALVGSYNACLSSA